jgi:FtsP/CotA-like multicopper oxidase with cupredoxin domain
MYVKAPPASVNPTGTFELRIRTVRPQPQSLKVRAFHTDAVQAAGVPLVRFHLAARAEAYDTTLPPTLPALPSFLQNIGATRDTAVVVFNDTNFVTRTPPGTPTDFYLGTARNHYMRFNDTVVYVPLSTRNVPVPMVLGDSQTWRVQNYGVSKNHPFHIHINPFQILHVSYGPNDKFRDYYAFLNAAAARGAPVWSDVVPLPVLWTDTVNGTPTSHPGEVMIAQRYDPFTGCPNCGPAYGQFVMHCHILGHEERGMMQLLQIFQTRQAAARFVLSHPRLIANELGLLGTRSGTRRTGTTRRAGSGHGSGAGSRTPGSGGGYGGGGGGSGGGGGHHHGG